MAGTAPAQQRGHESFVAGGSDVLEQILLGRWMHHCLKLLDVYPTLDAALAAG
ncbi:hypothetical protein [Amycolatopsis sp. lyj-23]|uniref:hypothetical protein n=1 Tax=Amycolatopsis sp. lyj-23 TaxID=2789283 RepID=UPI00397D0496